MTAKKQRIVGLLVAIALIAGSGAYGWWRLRTAAREGWAGMAYMPDVRSSEGKKAPSFPGLNPGGVFMVYPGGPAERAGIKRNSRIISVDGVPIWDTKKTTRIADKVRTGDVVTYRAETDGAQRDHRVRFESPMKSMILIAVLVTTWAVALTFLLIGTFVFWRLPGDSRATVFFAMTVFAALSFTATAITQLEGQNMRGFIVDTTSAAPLARPLIFVLAGLFFAPLLLHLALIFPKPRPVLARGRTLFTWMYGLPLYFCLCALVFLGFFQFLLTKSKGSSEGLIVRSFFWIVTAALAAVGVVALLRIVRDARRRGVKEGFVAHPLGVMSIILAFVMLATYFAGRAVDRTHSPWPILTVMCVVGLIFFLSFISYPVSTLIALFRSYRDSGVEERRQVKWPLWGTMFAVGLKILLLVFGLAVGFLVSFSKVNIPANVAMIPEMFSRVVYVMIPISFAFAILKYRLMNIDVIIRRTVLYSILSAVVFVLYGVLVAGVGTLLIRFARVQNTTMVIASTIVVALVAVPLRNRLQRMVDRNLFRERRDYPLALRNIGNAIGRGVKEFRKASNDLESSIRGEPSKPAPPSPEPSTGDDKPQA